MTMDQADAVPAYFPIRAPTTYTLGPIKATINPKNLPQDDAAPGIWTAPACSCCA